MSTPQYPQYPQYPQPQPPQQPAQRTGLQGWIARNKVLAGILALIVVMACCSCGLIATAATHGGGGTPTATTGAGAGAQTQATHAPAATKAPTATPKPKSWVTVQSFSGNGSKKTATFTAPDDYKLVWSCDPSSFYGGSYNLIVSVTADDGTPVDYGAINTICKDGNTSDTTEERNASGTVYLDVVSEGAWKIDVQVYQ